MKIKSFQFSIYFIRVKLLLNRQTGEAVAMKVVDTRKHPDASASVKKEVCIQKFLQHPYILRYFGTRRQNDIEYIFLEYASGGELFDRIGMYRHSSLFQTNQRIHSPEPLYKAELSLFIHRTGHWDAY